MDDEKQGWADHLRRELAAASALRRAALADPQLSADRLCLREWQSRRLARTHADLLASERYGPAAEFFLSDLYGPKDFSARDEEVARILPTLVAMLPTTAIRASALALEVDALSEELDAGLAALLRADGRIADIDDGAYADAYRRQGAQDKRCRQLALIGETGHALDHMTHIPLIGRVLKMMRVPAKLAGLAELHAFLQRGYAAFKHMNGAEEFLTTVVARERALMEALYAAR
ncbi:MAG: hypothetical protein HZC24_05620 [Rhodocyclales bacterium]|nr:hypothetical protein [Rhodocyclales bacterium]